MEISRESKHAIDPPLLRVAWNRNESIDHHLSFTVHATRTTNSYVSARSILEISGERWFFPSVRWKCRANALVVRANHHHHPFSFSPLDDKWKMQLSLDERIHRRTLHPPLNRLICVYTRASLRNFVKLANTGFFCKRRKTSRVEYTTSMNYRSWLRSERFGQVL